MIAFDVCAGLGGFSEGARRAGFDVYGVELDPDAVASHRLNVGPCALADITTWRPPFPADLVIGGEKLLDRPATTIQAEGAGRLARGGHKDRANGGESAWSGAVRLDAKQCAALMGYPASWRIVGKTLDSVHRQIGNGVPPQLAEAICRAAKKVWTTPTTPLRVFSVPGTKPRT